MIGLLCQERQAAADSENECGRAYATRPQLAVAALIHLLSRYPSTRKPALAHAVFDHLRMIGDEPALPTRYPC